MPLQTPRFPDRRASRRQAILALLALPLLMAGAAPGSRETSSAPTSVIAADEAPVSAASSAVVNLADLARAEQLRGATAPPVRVLLFGEGDDEGAEEPGTAVVPGTRLIRQLEGAATKPVDRLFVASPSPTKNYAGLDDIPMVDSSYIIIPPDVSGGVGPTHVMEAFNNNIRIRNKATGATLITIGPGTFWAPVTLGSERNALTDPRLTYDPYNNRWIMCEQTTTTNAVVLVAVSQTSDPTGVWFLYRFAGLSGSLGGNYLLDFPLLGFNRNWVAITINRYTTAGAFSYGICLALDYPQLRTGTGAGSLFTLNSGGGGTHFCASPAVTYSATQDSLFLVTHLGSAGATFAVDVISGTAAAPVYNLAAASNVRPGGGWTQPSGNIQPQSAPNVGASACGATPCKIETQDAQIRSAPVYRNGFIWYSQTIGLPAGGLTRTAAQWTKITPSTTPAFADGGRLDDPTATATNGGKWYDHVALSVNSSNDMMIGFTQFSSAQHPSAGYAMRLGTDAPGTLRDAFIYKVGDDYYHKTFTTTTGRNRWGDFSTTQVDPCDDQTLWTLQEYAKTRTGTDDGNTGSNSSRWASWWAAVAGTGPVASIACPADTNGSPGDAVSRMFRITNSGTGPGQFSYSITDAAGWGGPVSGTTPVLAPSSFFDVFVTFNVPSNCTPPSDIITFSAQVVGPTGCYSPVTCNSVLYCDLVTAALFSRFDAQPAAGGVDLHWWSDAVDQVVSWNVYRGESAEGPWVLVNDSPIAMHSGGSFSVRDDAAVTGSVYYRLGAVLKDGRVQMLGTTRLSATGESFSFAIAGSNPFSSGTMLRYTLPRAERVRIDIYSVTGERVRSLVDRQETAGAHTIEFSIAGGGRKLAPGVYMARITAGTWRSTLRLVAMQ